MSERFCRCEASAWCTIYSVYSSVLVVWWVDVSTVTVSSIKNGTNAGFIASTVKTFVSRSIRINQQWNFTCHSTNRSFEEISTFNPSYYLLLSNRKWNCGFQFWANKKTKWNPINQQVSWKEKRQIKEKIEQYLHKLWVPRTNANYTVLRDKSNYK